MTVTDLQTLSKIDIKSVALSSLADIKDINLSDNRSAVVKYEELTEQMHNPYCFRCGKVGVKIGFADTDASLDNRLESYFKSL